MPPRAVHPVPERTRAGALPEDAQSSAPSGRASRTECTERTERHLHSPPRPPRPARSVRSLGLQMPDIVHEEYLPLLDTDYIARLRVEPDSAHLLAQLVEAAALAGWPCT